MYSNQSPQTAYQQFYNNMPSYPQNNQQVPGKQTMVEKYPLQIWVAARAGMSLTCAADLNVPGEGIQKIRQWNCTPVIPYSVWPSPLRKREAWLPISRLMTYRIS